MVRPILISVDFGGTKVPKMLGLSLLPNTIIGGVYSNHQIDINDKCDEEIMVILYVNSVVTIQDTKAGQSPYFVIVVQ